MSAIAAVRAQTAQSLSVQVSGIFVMPGGEAFTDTKGGPGVEAQLRRRVPVTLGSGARPLAVADSLG